MFIVQARPQHLFIATDAQKNKPKRLPSPHTSKSQENTLQLNLLQRQLQSEKVYNIDVWCVELEAFE
jgi:hypothetical protein